MDIDVFQEKIVATIERYGRPPSMAEHLEKLGEEVGELACTVAQAGPNCHIFNAQQKVADECCDIINVCFSLMEHAGFKANHRLEHKLLVLNERIQSGRLDRKWGQKK